MQRSLNNAALSASRIELPTIVLAIVIYGAWIALTLWHALLPLPILGIAGGIVVAWHGSLQHETIHGHPTGKRWINWTIGAIPLSLWLPYSIYHRTHVAHHATSNITDPLDDPESQYLTRGSGIRYWLAKAEETLLGRLVLGPPIRVGLFLLSEFRRTLREPGAVSREWVPHMLGVGLLLIWLHHVGFAWEQYLLTFVYPGTALSLLRSFAEHRANDDRSARAAIIPRPGPFGLLFLNNNLHAVHHARPDLSWYQLPQYYRKHSAAFMSAPRYSTYGAIARRYLLKPHDDVLHPDYARRRVAE